jgi:hypothetical protein
MLPADWFEQLQGIYPKRQGDQGWAKVKKLVPRRIDEGHEWNDILKGATNYRIHCGRQQMIGTPFVKQACTFVGPDCWFEEWALMDLRTAHQIAQEAKWEALERRARALGFTTVDRQRGYDVALRAVEQVEAENMRRVTEPLRLKVVR